VGTAATTAAVAMTVIFSMRVMGIPFVGVSY
jgi:hypothetical protein